ncbi:MAG: 1-deoxy-D-xylulose-5-phosphate synthase [Culicoidibacterales bacterium]
MKLDLYPMIKDITIENLKEMTSLELSELSDEIRLFLTKELSHVGGHIGPNLGVVELTIALFRQFDSPTDAFFWDIGHQAYVQKILTGRASRFDTLRQFDGLSGFVKFSESIHDIWEAGHASTSLSGACGLSVQRKLEQKQYHIVSIIGDGALTGGMALEALNHIGDLGNPHIIILNDNNMSISVNVGALNKHINELRVNPSYLKAKKGTKIALSKMKLDKYLSKKIKNFKASMKSLLLRKKEHNFFCTMGIDYLGPIDGHDFEQLERAFSLAKAYTKPIIIHVLTKKGKGYSPAEQDKKGLWHGIGPYQYENGQRLRKQDKTMRQWSSAVSETVERLAAIDNKIIAITPAMLKGSKLNFFANKFPTRIFDVGIAEEHAMTFAAGTALKNGLRPFIAIYSTFLQRAYDQLLHDVARQNLPVIVGVDRCGFAGGDGETHHGIYDISLMRSIPNLTIMMGKDALETQNLLYNAFYNYAKLGPGAIRYPRGYTKLGYVTQFEAIKLGSWEVIQRGRDLAILTFGPQLAVAATIAKQLEKSGITTTIINCRFIKPMDTSLLSELFTTHDYLITIEEAIKSGGFGSGVLEYKSEYNYASQVDVFAIEDVFIEQGDNKLLQKLAGIDAQTITSKLKRKFNKID